jgi:hypothetical protein
MRSPCLTALTWASFIGATLCTPALAQSAQSMMSRSGLGSSNVYPVQTPYGTVPTYFPNGNPYGNPYGYRSPYSYTNPYGGLNPSGSYGTPVPAFQPYGNNYYGVNIGGNPLRFWRSPSGYYYPWVGGYGYGNSFPIYIVPPGQTNPTATLPPISTVVSDLDNYLDKAKESGKIDTADFTSLKRRAGDLLSKEKSLAYESGGLDQDQEADLRRDLDGLSGEVARRVRP